MGDRRLGQFELHEPLGSGSAATVWRARHLPTNLWVAVKALSGAHVARAAFLDGFRTEIRAVCRLDHPNVVQIFDHGKTTEAEARGNDLVAGAPWYAMGLASETIGDHVGIWTWADLSSMLEQLLQALAHAHAHGVIHRDVKPHNVLRGPDGIWLSDFGIAALSGLSVVTAGSPDFMAPEQRTAGPVGPPTDLFGVGRTALSLARGAAVPVGFSEWAHCLCATEVEARFECAADALAGLGSLGDDTAAFAVLEGGVDAREGTTWTGDDPTPAPAPERATGHGSFDRRRVQIPQQPPARVHTRAPVQGAALWGLRAPPEVGHDGIRDLFWEALCEVAATGCGQALVVVGDLQMGEAELLGGLTRVANAAAGAVSVRIDSAWVRAGATVRLIVEALSGGDPGRVGEFLAARGADRFAVRTVEAVLGGERVSATELRGVLEMLSGVASRGFGYGSRPIVVHVEDPQFDPVAVRLLARTAENWPILLLFSTSGRALEQSLFPDALGSLPQRTRTLPAVSDAELAEMLSLWLPLSESAIASVVGRARGRPIAAAEEASRLFERGVLEVALDEPEPPLPDLTPEERVVLERLAVFGGAMDSGRFEALSAGLGQARAGALDRWTRSGGLREYQHPAEVRLSAAWSRRLLTHVDPAAEISHHQWCAEALQGVWSRAAQRSRHRLQAGQRADAFEDLLEVASQRMHLADPRGAATALDQAEAIFEPFERSDAAIAGVALLRSELARREQQVDLAFEHARRAEDLVEREINKDLRGRVLHNAGRLRLRKRAYKEAEPYLLEAAAIARELGLDGRWGSCLLDLGDAARGMGELDRAAMRFREVIDVAGRGGRDHQVAWACFGLDDLATDRGSVAGRVDALRQAQEAVDRGGSELDRKALAVRRGGLARDMGDLASAEAAYRLALTGWPIAEMDNLNLGVVLLEQGRPLDALGCFEAIGPESLLHGAARACVAAAAARLGRWELATTAFAEALADLALRPLFDRDLILVGTWVAEAAEAAGQLALAERGREFVRAQRQRGA